MFRSLATYSTRYCVVHRPAFKMDGPSRKRRRLSAGDADGEDRTPRSLSRAISPPKRRRNAAATRTVIPSPFHLTAIRDLPPESNVDAVGLKDLIGDPLIAECWEFNYLHDVDFLMSHLDEDTRSLTKVHIVHGFWKREDPNKIFLEVRRLPSHVRSAAFRTFFLRW